MTKLENIFELLDDKKVDLKVLRVIVERVAANEYFVKDVTSRVIKAITPESRRPMAAKTAKKVTFARTVKKPKSRHERRQKA